MGTSSLSFDQAVSCVRVARQETSDDYFDLVEGMEALILSHRPSSVTEALAIIGVLRSNAEVGPRSDDLEIVALDNLETWLSHLS